MIPAGFQKHSRSWFRRCRRRMFQRYRRWNPRPARHLDRDHPLNRMRQQVCWRLHRRESHKHRRHYCCLHRRPSSTRHRNCRALRRRWDTRHWLGSCTMPGLRWSMCRWEFRKRCLIRWSQRGLRKWCRKYLRRNRSTRQNWDLDWRTQMRQLWKSRKSRSTFPKRCRRCWCPPKRLCRTGRRHRQWSPRRSDWLRWLMN